MLFRSKIIGRTWQPYMQIHWPNLAATQQINREIELHHGCTHISNAHIILASRLLSCDAVTEKSRCWRWSRQRRRNSWCRGGGEAAVMEQGTARNCCLLELLSVLELAVTGGDARHRPAVEALVVAPASGGGKLENTARWRGE